MECGAGACLAAAVITKKSPLPVDLSPKRDGTQVEAEANQYIPFALDEVNLDFQGSVRLQLRRTRLRCWLRHRARKKLKTVVAA